MRAGPIRLPQFAQGFERQNADAGGVERGHLGHAKVTEFSPYPMKSAATFTNRRDSAMRHSLMDAVIRR